MKPPSDAFLEKARELLGQAEAMLRIGFPAAAGRAAYFAGFHAAQALIFECDDRVLKTHSGVRAEYHRLIKDDARFDTELRAFLGRA